MEYLIGHSIVSFLICLLIYMNREVVLEDEFYELNTLERGCLLLCLGLFSPILFVISLCMYFYNDFKNGGK